MENTKKTEPEAIPPVKETIQIPPAKETTEIDPSKIIQTDPITIHENTKNLDVEYKYGGFGVINKNQSKEED